MIVPSSSREISSATSRAEPGRMRFTGGTLRDGRAPPYPRPRDVDPPVGVSGPVTDDATEPDRPGFRHTRGNDAMATGYPAAVTLQAGPRATAGRPRDPGGCRG